MRALAGGAGERARWPRGSHLGKSGWRPGRCAGPSSDWGGCWPSPAGSSAWFGRPPPSKRPGPQQPRQRGASCRLRCASADKSRRLGEAAERTPDTRWVDPPLRPRCGSALPAGGGTSQRSDGRWRGRWSPPPVPAPARNGSAVDAGRTARLSSWEAAASTIPAPGAASAPGPGAHQGRLRVRCSPAAARRPARQGREATGWEGARWGKPGCRDHNVSAENCTLWEC